jgi:fused signal recognition particle receptor
VELLIILLAVLVVVGVGAAFVGTRRRGRGVELEPPPTRVLEDDVPGDVLVEEPPAVEVEEPPVAAEPVAPVRPRFRDRLGKARGVFAGFLGRKTIDEATWEELEDALILADVGIGLTGELLDTLRLQVKEQSLTDASALRGLLAQELKARLAADRTLRLDEAVTNVWLLVGVNGVGKTTTIGQVARRMADDGVDTVLAAGDTFRAAAAEQLGTWAERAGSHFVRGGEGADPSSVIFDAVESAAARGAGLVLGDTAGRLHTKSNLMEELAKVRRVAEKGSGVVTEVLLVLDATTGQNGLVQAREFTAAVDVTGVVLTKLDGSAKGGIVLAIQHEFGIPVKLVGLGEQAGDLVDFDPDEFVEALLG